MGNNNNNNNNKKELEDKMEMRDSVKIEVVHEDEEVKKPEATIKPQQPNVIKKPELVSTNNTVAPNADIAIKKAVIEKEIADLKESIKVWEKRISRSYDSVDKAIYADKIMQANIRIKNLNGELTSKEMGSADVKAPTISEKKPAPESNLWRFSI